MAAGQDDGFYLLAGTAGPAFLRRGDRRGPPHVALADADGRGVTRPDLARWLCLRLNGFACGWSFAYDAAGGEHQCHRRDVGSDHLGPLPAEFREWGEARGLVVRHDRRWARRGARWGRRRCRCRRGGGEPARPGRAGLPAHRLPGRPEWVFDPTPYRFGSLDDIAGRSRGRMGVVADRSEVDDDGFSVDTLQPDGRHVSSELRASFDTHPVFGAAWRTDVVLPWARPEDVAAATAGRGRCSTRPISNLMGAWVGDGNRWSTGSGPTTNELRSYEQLRSFEGHTADLLWSVSASSTDALSLGDGRRLAGVGATGPPTTSRRHSGRCCAHAAGRPGARRGVASRRGSRRQAAVVVAATEPCSSWPGGSTRWARPCRPSNFAVIPRPGRSASCGSMRHPFLPRYVDLGPCETDEELAAR